LNPQSGPRPFWQGDAERRLRLALAALDNAHDTLLIHDADGRLLYFNRQACEHLGFSAEEFRDLPPWGFAGGESPEIIAERVRIVSEKGSMRFLSDRFAASGERRTYEVESRLIESDEGPLFVSASRDVTEQIRADEILKHLAFHDALTGLANRALFDDRLDEALASATDHGFGVGLAYIDVDDFKEINDTYGHAFGDEVLAVLGERLASCVREEDTVARIGGDEFAVIFPRLDDPDHLRRIAEKMSERLSSPLHVCGQALAITVSLGCAAFDREDDTPRSMIMRADIEMYEAKRAKAGAQAEPLVLPRCERGVTCRP